MKFLISNIHFAAKGDRTSGPPPPTPKCTLLETIISDRIVRSIIRQQHGYRNSISPTLILFLKLLLKSMLLTSFSTGVVILCTTCFEVKYESLCRIYL
jgi:hypothetical protein